MTSATELEAKATAPSFVPTPKQKLIWDILAKAEPESRTLIGYGGAAGGGKTRALAELAIDLAIEFPGNRIIVARRDFSDLRETTMEQFFLHCPPDLIAKRNMSENWCHLRKRNWPRGLVSKIQFRELKDYLGLGSEEYGAVIIDEAGEVPEASALMLLSRLRWRLPPIVRNRGVRIKYAFVAASNPWPGWFKRWFVDRQLPEDVLAHVKATVHFIPAKASDNPYLDPNYEIFLRTIYPKEWVDRLIEGSWDVYEGQVYPQFNPEIHEWRYKNPDGTYKLPKFDRLVGGLDFGEPSNTAHASAGIVAGVWGNRLIRLAEFEENGPNVLERQLDWMLKQEQIWSEHVDKRKNEGRIVWCADKSQMAAIPLLRKAGFIVKPSRGGRDSVRVGITLVANRLNPDKNGIPGSFYLPHLVKFRDAMVRYRWPQRDQDSELPPPKTPIKVGDDLLDADRYMHELVDAWPAIGDPQRQFARAIPRYHDKDDDDVVKYLFNG